jgi:hypothetical protein
MNEACPRLLINQLRVKRQPETLPGASPLTTTPEVRGRPSSVETRELTAA